MVKSTSIFGVLKFPLIFGLTRGRRSSSKTATSSARKIPSWSSKNDDFKGIYNLSFKDADFRGFYGFYGASPALGYGRYVCIYIYAYIARGHQILAPGTCGRKHAGNPHDWYFSPHFVGEPHVSLAKPPRRDHRIFLPWKMLRLIYRFPHWSLPMVFLE